jgi:hypothetical protein
MKSTAIIAQHGICVGMRKSLKFLTAQFNDVITIEEANVKSSQNDERYDDCAEGATDKAKGRLSFAKELQKHMDKAINELIKEQKYLITLKKEYKEFHGEEALKSVLSRIHESGVERSQRYEKENKLNKNISKTLSEMAMIFTGARFSNHLKDNYLSFNSHKDTRILDVRRFLKKCKELEGKKSNIDYNPTKNLNETQIFKKLSKNHEVSIIEMAKEFNLLFSDIIKDDDIKMDNFLNIIQLNLKKL